MLQAKLPVRLLHLRVRLRPLGWEGRETEHLPGAQVQLRLRLLSQNSDRCARGVIEAIVQAVPKQLGIRNGCRVVADGQMALRSPPERARVLRRGSEHAVVQLDRTHHAAEELAAAREVEVEGGDHVRLRRRRGGGHPLHLGVRQLVALARRLVLRRLEQLVRAAGPVPEEQRRVLQHLHEFAPLEPLRHFERAPSLRVLRVDECGVAHEELRRLGLVVLGGDVEGAGAGSVASIDRRADLRGDELRHDSRMPIAHRHVQCFARCGVGALVEEQLH
mmetsp:Transcript_23244/g.57686  ORF Transcript_23244/g.57686 Transcript_23244/m.57686 type:complete len:276 (-) Transcript_23244:348-1175(-)